VVDDEGDEVCYETSADPAGGKIDEILLKFGSLQV
jgi:hypothetical protein